MRGSSPINILHLVGSFHQGGSERQALQLARQISAAANFQVHVACMDGSGVLREETEAWYPREIREYPLTSFHDGNTIKQLRRFARHLREAHISVVHTHDFYTNIFGMAAGALARTPARVAARRETGGMRTAAQQAVERGAYRLAHKIIANADAVRDQLIAAGVEADKIVTIHNGLDMRRVAPPHGWQREDFFASLGLPTEEGRLFVTIVANLHHEVKDHATFLRAAARTRSLVPGAAFVLAGEGTLIEPLRAQARSLGIERDVFFIGRCAQVAELLAASDVCVLSSVSEGFSNSILEYMAASRPVVATDVGGAREAIVEGETGFLVRAGDDEAMAQRITGLLRDAEKRRVMGERGRRVVEEKFSCEAQLRRTESLYEKLIAYARGGEVAPAALYADAGKSDGALSGR